MNSLIPFLKAVVMKMKAMLVIKNGIKNAMHDGIFKEKYWMKYVWKGWFSANQTDTPL